MRRSGSVRRSELGTRSGGAARALGCVVLLVAALGCSGEDGPGNGLLPGSGGASGSTDAGSGGAGGAAVDAGEADGGGERPCMPAADWPTCETETRFSVPYRCGAGAYCAECYLGGPNERRTGCVLNTQRVVDPDGKEVLGTFYCVEGSRSMPGVVLGCE
jgi:hypothetical protein